MQRCCCCGRSDYRPNHGNSHRDCELTAALAILWQLMKLTCSLCGHTGWTKSKLLLCGLYANSREFVANQI